MHTGTRPADGSANCNQKHTDFRRSIRRPRDVLEPGWCTVVKSLIEMVARLYLKSCCKWHWPWCAWESHAAICTCIICTRLLRRFARLDTCLFCHCQCQAVGASGLFVINKHLSHHEEKCTHTKGCDALSICTRQSRATLLFRSAPNQYRINTPAPNQ